MIHKISSFITSQYDIILAPKLDKESMLSSDKLTTKVARQLSVIPNNKIVDLMIQKAKDKNKKVLQVKEHYTTQTCT